MKKIFSLFVTCLLVMSATAVPVARRTAMTDKAVVRFDAQAARQNRHAANNDVTAKLDKSAKMQAAAAPVRLEISDEAMLSARRQLFHVAKAQQNVSLNNVDFAYAWYYNDIWGFALYAIEYGDTVQVGMITYAGGDATHLVASNIIVNDSTNYVVAYGVLDTIQSVAGLFSIAFDHVAQGVPYYHLTSSELNSADDAMELDVTFPVVYAIDYLKYYYAMTYPDYCGSYFDCDYVIELEDAPFVPSGDTIRVTLGGLKYTDKVATAGWWQLSGYNADSTLYVTFSNIETIGITQAAGTYDFATEMDKSYTAVYLIDGEDAEMIDFKEGTITLDVDSAGVAHLDADMHAKNGDVYIFDLTSKIPFVSNNVITLSYSNGKLNVTTTNNDPYILFIAEKDSVDYDNVDTLNMMTANLLESLAYYQMLSMVSFSGNQAIDVEDFYYQLYEEEMATGEYVALACAHDEEYRAGDAVYELFNYVAPAIVPTGDTIRIVGSGLEFRDAVAEYGWWQIMGYSDDQQYYASFSNSNDISQIAGTYDYANDMDKEYTSLYHITDPTSETGAEKISLKQGTIVMTVVDGVVALHAELLAADGVVYIIDLTPVSEPEPEERVVYNVAEAIAAADAGTIKDNDAIAVRGVITNIVFKGRNFALYGSATIYVSDATGAQGSFEFFNCYSLLADTFRTSYPAFDATSTTFVQFESVTDGNGVTIHVGDTVIAEGLYKKYNTVYELNTGCYLTDIMPYVAAPEPEYEPTPEDYNVFYRNQYDGIIASEQVTLTLPVAPVIQGFTFVGWDVVAGHLEDGINIQAVYTSNPETAAPAVYVNPANPAQKLIRNGNVYILHDGNTYTVSGAKVR